MTDEKSHTEAAEPHGAPQATDTRKNATCAPSGLQKRSGGHLDPIETTRATAGQFGHPADDGLIEREAAVHMLKIDTQPMDDLMSGAKTGEIRRDDRGFAVGDSVFLTCADGRTATRRITHIQRGYGLPDDLCVLSYARATPAARFTTDNSGDANKKVADLIDRAVLIERLDDVIDDYNHGLGWDASEDVRYIRDEIVRAIPAAQPAPRVKPLVWEKTGFPDEWRAGDYAIWHEPQGYQLLFWSIIEGEHHPTLEAAQDAAWRHHSARILSALEPAAPDGTEVAMAECQAFSAGYEAGEKATAGGEELAKLRTEVERLRDLVGKNTDASLRVAERKDAEIARLREALSECLGTLTGGMDGTWTDGVDCREMARAALRNEQKGDA